MRFLAGTVPAAEEFDLVLANLPYVAESEWGGLQREVTEWEPREALLAGRDGLDAYRALMPQLERASARNPGGSAFAVVALEVGEGQGTAVMQLLEAAGYLSVHRLKDLAGIERVVLGER